MGCGYSRRRVSRCWRTRPGVQGLSPEHTTSLATVAWTAGRRLKGSEAERRGEKQHALRAGVFLYLKKSSGGGRRRTPLPWLRGGRRFQESQGRNTQGGWGRGLGWGGAVPPQHLGVAPAAPGGLGQRYVQASSAPGPGRGQLEPHPAAGELWGTGSESHVGLQGPRGPSREAGQWGPLAGPIRWMRTDTANRSPPGPGLGLSSRGHHHPESHAELRPASRQWEHPAGWGWVASGM